MSGYREKDTSTDRSGGERKIVAQTGVGEREREREPPKKRGMVGERKIGRETGGGRERETETATKREN